MGEAGSPRAGAERFIGADSLRAIGALGVVVFHCSVFAGLGAGLLSHGWFVALGRLPLRVIEGQQFMVYVFFALSGYLLGRPFISALVEDRPLPAVKTYLRNRWWRLAPGIVATFVITLAVLGNEGSSAARIAAVPLMIQNYYPSNFSNQGTIHFWTLDTEVAYYLLLPVAAILLTYLLRGRWSPAIRRNVVIAGILAISALSIWLSNRLLWTDFVHQREFPRIGFAFAPGLLLAAVSTSAPARLASSQHGNRIATAMLLAAIAPLVYYVVTIEHPVLWAHNTAAVTGAGLVVAATLVRQWSDDGCWRVLDNRPLQWLGKRSYSFYLLHLIVIRELAQPFHRHLGLTAFVVYALLSVVFLMPISALAYALLEQPFIARRKAWRAPAQASPQPAAAPAPGVAVQG